VSFLNWYLLFYGIIITVLALVMMVGGLRESRGYWGPFKIVAISINLLFMGIAITMVVLSLTVDMPTG
jgi:hypothetical protein